MSKISHIVWKIVRISAGLLLILLGFVGILIPFMPQLIFWVAGLSLLAPDVPLAKKVLEWGKDKFSQLCERPALKKICDWYEETKEKILQWFQRKRPQ